MAEIKQIICPSAKPCQKCGSPIRANEEAYWVVDDGLFHLGCFEANPIPHEIHWDFLNDLDQRFDHFMMDLETIRSRTQPEQEPFLGSLLFRLVESAKSLLEHIKEQVRQRVVQENHSPGTVKVGSKCHVTIPKPQYKVRKGVLEEEVISAIGLERYQALFEKRERIELILRGDPTPEESADLIPLLDRVEHTPRVSFKK